MSSAEAWFTDRREALAAVDAVLDGDGARVLLLYGASGSGKSALLERLSRLRSDVHGGVLDAEALVEGMARPEFGADDAALELLGRIGRRLASAAPWWRRRWLLRRSARIGTMPRIRVHAEQKAMLGGVINHAAVTANPPSLTQGERRLAWEKQLEAVARRVRRRRCVLLLDTCERLAYFDEVQPPSGNDPYGLGLWFGGVVSDLLTAMPRLRVVIASTHRGAITAHESAPAVGCHPCAVHDLRPWSAADTRAYLARRGIDPALGPGEATLPVEAAWLADLLAHGAQADADALPAVSKRARDSRSIWVTSHVLRRLAPVHRTMLPAAAVLRVFTPGALATVAAAGSAGAQPARGDEWFGRFSALTAVNPVPDTDEWRLHAAVRGWLLEVYRDTDAQLPASHRVLPRLHQAAADYHQAMDHGRFSPNATRHLFVLGRAVPAWTAELAHALTSRPFDLPATRLLVDVALDPEVRGPLAERQPEHLADAYLSSALIRYSAGRHLDAQADAEQALTLYQAIDSHHPGIAVTARIAGQCAWKSHRFGQAVEHWGTASASPDDASPKDLLPAFAEAVLCTGDLPHADALLSEALRRSSAAADPEQPEGGCATPRRGEAGVTAHVCASVPAALPEVPLGDERPQNAVPAHLHLLLGRTALHRAQWDRARQHLRLAEEAAADLPHILAFTHRWQAEIAIGQGDSHAAELHVHQGLAASRICPDRRCLAWLLITQAALARHRAVSRLTATTPRLPGTIPVGGRVERTRLLEEAQSLLTTALAQARELGDLHAHAYARLAMGRTDEALDAFRALGDRHGQALATRRTADAARARGDVEQARLQGDVALRLYRNLGEQHGEAAALQSLAETARLRGDVTNARALAREALALHRACGDRYGEGDALRALADTALAAGDFAAAGTRAAEALAVHRGVGFVDGEAMTLRILAATTLIGGDVPGARTLATETLSLNRELGRAGGEADALRLLAEIARLDGDLAQAHRLATDARGISSRNGNLHNEALALLILADVARLRNNHTQAARLAHDALELHRALGDRQGEADVLRVLADTARRQGNLECAEQRATEALRLHRCLSNDWGAADALDSLAETAAAREEPLTARALWLEAADLYDRIGRPDMATARRRRADQSRR